MGTFCLPSVVLRVNGFGRSRNQCLGPKMIFRWRGIPAQIRPMLTNSCGLALKLRCVPCVLFQSHLWPRDELSEPLRVRPNQTCPLKKGRHGDFQPGFCGTSVRHAQWVRQVRRLQAFCHLLRSTRDVNVQTAESWGSILRAQGFQPDFPTWWTTCQYRTSNAPDECPIAPPSQSTAVAMFDSVQLVLLKLSLSNSPKGTQNSVGLRIRI